MNKTQEAPARSPGLSFNECVCALLDSLSVVLHVETYRALRALGISGPGINGWRRFDALQIADVIFHPGGAFDFSRDLRVAGVHTTAIIIPCYDAAGDIVDLAAWNIESGAFGLWRGVASMLGEDQIGTPRVESEALVVFADAASWLRAGRRGVVVIDPARARWRLAGEHLVVDDPAFGYRLHGLLRLPDPKIFVASNGARCAA